MRTMVALVGVAVSAGLCLTGCASGSKEAVAARASALSVPSADASCRVRWRDLERQTEKAGSAELGGVVHRSLASRYTGLAASAAYWRANATGQGCGAMLSGQQNALLQLRMLDSKAGAYDIALRTQRALDERSRLAVSTLGETAPVASAYASLTRLAPAVTAAVAPGVATLDTFDPARPAEVDQALANLALLARSSDGWAGWSTSMNRVTAFQRQQQARISAGS